MEVLKSVRQLQERAMTLERENYALKQTKGDATVFFKMDEKVKQLEGQLKDKFKDQMDMVAVAKENIEMSNRVRDLERNLQVHKDRLKEYEEIMKAQGDEADSKGALAKTYKAENEAFRAQNNFLEE